MNFTREPIIETIITPKDGYKLVVRNSKGGCQEEYHVDAVEVVSFGHSFFFRSLERPKSFLVPVSDYEIIESKETRVVLKNVNIERSIKIGGGRQQQQQQQQQHHHSQKEREASEEAPSHDEEEVASDVSAEGTSQQPQQQSSKSERKRDRRRNRRGRRSGEDRQQVPVDAQKEVQHPTAEPGAQGGVPSDETQVSSSMFSSLFPPPPTLISETISRYKDKGFELTEGDILSESLSQAAESAESAESPESAEVPEVTEVTEVSEVAETAAQEPVVEQRATEEKKRKKKEGREPVIESGEEEVSNEAEAHIHRTSEDDSDYFMI